MNSNYAFPLFQNIRCGKPRFHASTNNFEAGCWNTLHMNKTDIQMNFGTLFQWKLHFSVWFLYKKADIVKQYCPVCRTLFWYKNKT